MAAILGRLTPSPVVKVVELPGLPEGGDIYDWLEARDAVEPDELRRQVETLADGASAINSKPLRQNRAPVLAKLADVEPEPIHWLWPGRIALGKLSLLVGDPDLGKSLITLDITARVSTGAVWPDNPGCVAPIGGVVVMSAEDDLADTVRPRLDAAGADVARVVALTGVRGPDAEGDYVRPVDLSRDLEQIEAAMDTVADCRLVVIDPISAYLGRTDSYRNAEVRGLLAPLVELAGRRGVAIVAVDHLRKSEGKAVYRPMGSLAFAATARAVWAVARDKADDDRRLFVLVKGNLARDRSGLAYRTIESRLPNVPRVEWEPDPVDISADEALAADRNDDGHDDAGDWLQEALANGRMPAAEVLKEGRSNGYSEKAIRKAHKVLGGARQKEGFGAGGTWYWSLPTAFDAVEGSIDVIDAQSQKQGNNANNGQQCSEAGSSRPIDAIDGIDAQSQGTGNNANNGQEWGEV